MFLDSIPKSIALADIYQSLDNTGNQRNGGRYDIHLYNNSWLKTFQKIFLCNDSHLNEIEDQWVSKIKALRTWKVLLSDAGES